MKCLEALDTSSDPPFIMGNTGHGLGPVPGMSTTPVDPGLDLGARDAQENSSASSGTLRCLPDHL